MYIIYIIYIICLTNYLLYIYIHGSYIHTYTIYKYTISKITKVNYNIYIYITILTGCRPLVLLVHYIPPFLPLDIQNSLGKHHTFSPILRIAHNSPRAQIGPTVCIFVLSLWPYIPILAAAHVRHLSHCQVTCSMVSSSRCFSASRAFTQAPSSISRCWISSWARCRRCSSSCSDR